MFLFEVTLHALHDPTRPTRCLRRDQPLAPGQRWKGRGRDPNQAGRPWRLAALGVALHQRLPERFEAVRGGVLLQEGLIGADQTGRCLNRVELPVAGRHR